MAVAAVRTSRIIEREREESGLVYILLLDSQSSSFASSPFLSSPSSILVRMLLFIMCPHLLSLMPSCCVWSTEGPGRRPNLFSTPQALGKPETLTSKPARSSKPCTAGKTLKRKLHILGSTNSDRWGNPSTRREFATRKDNFLRKPDKSPKADRNSSKGLNTLTCYYTVSGRFQWLTG